MSASSVVDAATSTWNSGQGFKFGGSGVWCLVFGVWCFGVLVFGVWCLVFDVWCLVSGV